MASSQVQAGPPNDDRQLLGGDPSGPPSAHTYQSRWSAERLGARVHEPRMPVARVVRHEVDQHADPAIGGLRHQPIEILQRAEVRIDIGVVRDVVSPVRVRGGVDRTEPDAVDRRATTGGRDARSPLGGRRVRSPSSRRRSVDRSGTGRRRATNVTRRRPDRTAASEQPSERPSGPRAGSGSRRTDSLDGDRRRGSARDAPCAGRGDDRVRGARDAVRPPRAVDPSASRPRRDWTPPGWGSP